MDDRGSDSSSTFQRGLRTMDEIVIASTFLLMFFIFLFIRQLNCADMFVLNLIHSIDVFMAGKDWRDGALNIFFGVMYLTGAFHSSLHLALPCMVVVVVLWIASCITFGCPHVKWIFLICLLMWGLKFLYRREPDVIVVIAIGKTVKNYFFSLEKSLGDIMIICSFITLHLALFAVENVAFTYIFVSYLLSFVWMLLKTPVQ